MHDEIARQSGRQRTGSRPRLHLVYFALAIFDLLAVSLGLYLIDRLTHLHQESIQVTQVWGRRLDDYVDLMRMAAAANAPGNDVFNTRDIDSESKRLDEAQSAFAHRAGELREELARNAQPAQANTLLAQFDAIGESMDRMVSRERSIFEQMRLRHIEQAGEEMALMDRQYVGVIDELGKLGVIVRALQREQFDQQIAAAGRWQRLEYLIAMLIVIMVAGIALYGHTLTCRLRQAADELHQHREHLESLVQERTAQLEVSHEQLRQADRLASMGTLAAGLGHDMNNVLLPIRARLDALGATDLSPHAREQCAAVQSSIAFLQQLSDGLHLLALDPREPGASSGRTDIASWWKQVVPLLMQAAPKRVRFESDISNGLPPVAIAPHRLTQAVLNLVVNACEAIRDVGIVRVAAKAIGDPPSVRIIVSDDGQGMTPEVRNHAMDPFFTTKKRGLGTGLGLSLVHGVAKASGGRVEIDSQPGCGTAVSLIIPAIGASNEHRAADDTERRVGVSIADRRAASFVSAMVQAAGFVPVRANGENPGSCRVWITQPGSVALDAARELLRQDRRSRVVVFGPPTDEWTALGASAINDVEDVEDIRRVIHEALLPIAE